MSETYAEARRIATAIEAEGRTASAQRAARLLRLLATQAEADDARLQDQARLIARIAELEAEQAKRTPIGAATIDQLALKAGAAKFYPAGQRVKEDNYLVSKGFLERFAAGVQVPLAPLTTAQMEAGRNAIFSTGNPFCPCDSKTFSKVAVWVMRQYGIGP